MASANTIRRLHAAAPQTERAPVKLPNLGNLEIDVSEPSMLELFHRSLTARARHFALPTGEERFGSPALMNSVMPIGIPAGRATFSDVAARETADQIRNSAMRRMERNAHRGAGHSQHGGARVQF
jgi:hypothetical protein